MSILPPLPAGFRRLRRAMLLSAAVAVMFAAAGLTLVGTGGVAEATADWGPSGGRAAEQVTVHGQWSIRVSDSAGAAVRTVDFTNDLTPAGARTLAAILAGDAVAGGWSIQLGSTGGIDLCASAGAGECDLDGADLTVVTSDVGELGGAVVLDVSARMERSGSIDHVRTRQFACAAEHTPSVCAADPSSAVAATVSEADFTATDVDPIAVAAGDVVEVTVVISFG